MSETNNSSDVTPEAAQAMAAKASAQIPAHPAVAAKQAVAASQPATSPANAPSASETESVGDSSGSDMFADLFDQMENDTRSTPPPAAPNPEFDSRPPAVPYQSPQHRVAPPQEQNPPAEELASQEAPTQEAPQVSDPVQPDAPIQLTAEQLAQYVRAQTQQATEPSAEPQIDMQALAAQAVDRLASSAYALNEEQQTAMLSEPETVLPRIAAQLHVNVMQEMAQQIAQALPNMIGQQIQDASRVRQVEDQFFTQFPTLNKPEYRDTVAESLRMVRQFNPNADRATVMRDGAALAAMRLKQSVGNPQQQTAPQGHPQQAAQQSFEPFAPAQTSVGGNLPPAAPVETNVFEDIFNDPNW